MKIRGILAQFAQREAGPIVQFIKYGIAGGVATAVHVTVFALCACFVLPALTAGDPAVEYLGFPVATVGESTRALYAMLDNVIAFLFSNLTAYVINIFWVFKPGRHKRSVEVGLFFAGSAISLGVGSGLMWLIIRWQGTETTYAFGMNIIAAVLINYAARKYLIFKG